MKIKPFRIPKHVVLPGLLVHVKQHPRAETPLEGDDGGWSYDPLTGEATIYIADDMREVAKQRYTLIHELGHVWWDYFHVALKFHPDLVKIC